MSTRITQVLAYGVAAWIVTAGSVHAQMTRELSRAMLAELTGFVHSAYFNANRISEMPKFSRERAATQPEVLAAVASALRVRQRPCSAVVDADYVDDTGYNLAIICSEARYVVDAGRGKISP